MGICQLPSAPPARLLAFTAMRCTPGWSQLMDNWSEIPAVCVMVGRLSIVQVYIIGTVVVIGSTCAVKV